MGSPSKSPVVYCFLVLLILNGLAETVRPAPIARPNCADRCGDVSIPFPFGIGPNPECFLNDWYEIVCNQTSSPGTPTAVLKRTNLEVTNIALGRPHPGTLEVMSPIIFSENCSNNNGRNGSGNRGLNLGGSPFIYSESGNKFTAVGCNNLATMTGTEPVFVGCKSDCKANITAATPSRNSNVCSGTDCCQTTIPSQLSIFNTSFGQINEDNSREFCRYGFIVELEWWSQNGNNMSDPFVVQQRNHVPALLEWRMFSWHENSRNLYTSRGFGGDANCLKFPDLPSNGTEFDFFCECLPGYQGNPYVAGGCGDINECEDPTRNFCGANCVNTVGSFHCTKQKIKPVIRGISISLGTLFLLLFIWGSYKVIKKIIKAKRKKKFFKRNGGLLLQQQVSSTEESVQTTKLFNSNDLEKATDHFNETRILGQGGQGTVYKGMLDDGKIVAVKKSKAVDQGVNLEQFINEVFILSQINHRNVVKLHGCCLETEVPLLVYEFIPNGTLYGYLHDKNDDFVLTWDIRLKIATEVAGAIAHLHSTASIPIYHRDIKSANILLDHKYRAKVADFGTSKSVAIDQTHVTTVVQGTFGYLDPEYFHTSQFTDKSDVYSFGVVLVELLTGEKAVSLTRSKQGGSLATLFILSVEENNLFDILDSQVASQGKKEDILAVAELAKECLNWNSKKRPTMTEVSMRLEAVRKLSDVSENAEEEEEEPEGTYRREEIEMWEVASMAGGLDTITCSSSVIKPPRLPSEAV